MTPAESVYASSADMSSTALKYLPKIIKNLSYEQWPWKAWRNEQHQLVMP